MTTQLPNRFSPQRKRRAYLQSLLDSLAVDLHVAIQAEHDHTSERLGELHDLLVLSQAYIELLRSSDVHTHLHAWHDNVQSTLDRIIHERLSS